MLSNAQTIRERATAHAAKRPASTKAVEIIQQTGALIARTFGAEGSTRIETQVKALRDADAGFRASPFWKKR